MVAVEIELKNLLQHSHPQAVEELLLDNRRLHSLSLIRSHHHGHDDFIKQQLQDQQLLPPAGNGNDTTTPLFNSLDLYTNLVILSLNNVGLSSLEYFPATLSKLRKLVISDNKITNGLDNLVGKNLNHLVFIDLSNNKISDVNVLLPLNSLPALRHISLIDCPITKLENYRSEIFSILPGLETIDAQDREGNEYDEVSEEEEEDEEEEEEGVAEEEEDQVEPEEDDNENEEEEDEEDDLEEVDENDVSNNIPRKGLGKGLGKGKAVRGLVSNRSISGGKVMSGKGVPHHTSRQRSTLAGENEEEEDDIDGEDEENESDPNQEEYDEEEDEQDEDEQEFDDTAPLRTRVAGKTERNGKTTRKDVMMSHLTPAQEQESDSEEEILEDDDDDNDDEGDEEIEEIPHGNLNAQTLGKNGTYQEWAGNDVEEEHDEDDVVQIGDEEDDEDQEVDDVSEGYEEESEGEEEMEGVVEDDEELQHSSDEFSEEDDVVEVGLGVQENFNHEPGLPEDDEDKEGDDDDEEEEVGLDYLIKGDIEEELDDEEDNDFSFTNHPENRSEDEDYFSVLADGEDEIDNRQILKRKLQDDDDDQFDQELNSSGGKKIKL